MSHTASLRRTASAAGATALLGIVLAAPAIAGQDSSTGGFTANSTTTAPSGSAGVERERREGGIAYPQFDATSPGAATPSAPTIVWMEDHSVEYLQVAAGVLAGIALAAAGSAVVSRRSPRGLTPA